MNLTEKFYLIKCEELIDESIHPDRQGILINFDLLEDSDKEVLIKSMDFSINKDAIRTDVDTNFDEDLGKPCWKLVDYQGGNLGNIESDEFDIGDYDAILDRLDNYYRDYGYFFVYELDRDNIPYEIIDVLSSSILHFF